jgi:hypothetical protein
MKRVVNLTLAMVVALPLASCSRDDASETRRDRVTTTTAPERSDADASSPEPTTTTTGAPAPPDAVFGQAFTWNDGLEITVSPPERFSPTGAPNGEGSPSYVKLVVRVANGSNGNYQPTLTFTASERGSTEATTVLLTDAGAAGFPAANIAPGDEVAFSIGFELDDPDELVLEVAPGVGYPPATFAT